MSQKKIHDDVIYGRAALKRGEPWIVPAALEFLREIIDPDWNVFEWGSGGSTVFWARSCEAVISIEHHSEWYHRVRKMLDKEGLWGYYEGGSCLIMHIPADHKLGEQLRDDKKRFVPYASAIEWMLPPESCDMVFVDGEASCRGLCLTNALDYVRPGGWLMVDNSNWIKRDLGPDWERTDFIAKGLKWVGQPGTFDWWTSFWQKRGDAFSKAYEVEIGREVDEFLEAMQTGAANAAEVIANALPITSERMRAAIESYIASLKSDPFQKPIIDLRMPRMQPYPEHNPFSVFYEIPKATRLFYESPGDVDEEGDLFAEDAEFLHGDITLSHGDVNVVDS